MTQKNGIELASETVLKTCAKFVHCNAQLKFHFFKQKNNIFKKIHTLTQTLRNHAGS